MADAARCPKHNAPWLDGDFHGRRRCTFYVPELGVSEDYGCPQPADCGCGKGDDCQFDDFMRVPQYAALDGQNSDGRGVVG